MTCNLKTLTERFVYNISSAIVDHCYCVQSDPFLKLKIGKEKIDDVDNFIPNTLNPVFGK